MTKKDDELLLPTHVQMDIGLAADADATYCLLSFYHLRLRLRHTHIKKDGPMSTRRSTTLPTNCYCCYLLFGQIYKYTRINRRSRLTSFTHTVAKGRTSSTCYPSYHDMSSCLPVSPSIYCLLLLLLHVIYY